MTIQELQEALSLKGFRLQERVDPEYHQSVFWAVRPHSLQEYHLGVKDAVLSMQLHRFLQSSSYQEIGRDREALIDAFVTEWIESVGHDYVYEENRQNLHRRIQRLYDELRRADW